MFYMCYKWGIAQQHVVTMRHCVAMLSETDCRSCDRAHDVKRWKNRKRCIITKLVRQNFCMIKLMKLYLLTWVNLVTSHIWYTAWEYPLNWKDPDDQDSADHPGIACTTSKHLFKCNRHNNKQITQVQSWVKTFVPAFGWFGHCHNLVVVRATT